ncbi:hypothetical protein [Martelella mediterranea]|uniref:Uncharacterized protein n=1 Tax=Martelella mediterranea TaxID=293089 RepID=A0A4R3NF80_9HYPH|nr:hypothetical protein [Martelella mediterranea]TCT28931.1 hypothetical protein EDC90_105513 [Martelella mediterranea]
MVSAIVMRWLALVIVTAFYHHQYFKTIDPVLPRRRVLVHWHARHIVQVNLPPECAFVVTENHYTSRSCASSIYQFDQDRRPE